MVPSRRLGALGVVLVMFAVTVGLAACGSSSNGSSTGEAGASSASEAGGEKVSIAFVGPTGASEVVYNAYEGASKFAEANGATVANLNSGEPNPQHQAEIAENAVTSGRYDAMIIYPYETASALAGIEQAADAGMKTVTIFATQGPDIDATKPQIPAVSGQVFSPWNELGAALGESMVEACGDADPCKVAYIPGFSALVTEKDFIDAMTAVLKEHPSISYSETKPGEYNPTTAQGITEDLLTKAPDTDIIGTAGDQAAVGIVQAVESAGLEEQVKVYGQGASQWAVDSIHAGKLYGSVVNNSQPGKVGEQAASMAIKAVRGEKIANPGVPATVPGIPLVLTQENQSEWTNYVPGWKG